MEQAEDLEKIALWSIYGGRILKSNSTYNWEPLNVLFVSEVGSGKTTLVKQFVDIPTVLEVTDATSYALLAEDRRSSFGLLTVPADDRGSATKWQNKTHIVIPDLLTPLSRPKESSASLLGTITSLTEEGVKYIQSYHHQVQLKVPMRAGLITVITSGEFLNKARHYGWATNGFLSRFFVLTYKWSNKTAAMIAEVIAGDDGGESSMIDAKNFPDIPVYIDLPSEVGEMCYALGKALSDRLRILIGMEMVQTHPSPHRMQVKLQALCKARALSEGRDVVGGNDFDEIGTILSKHMNYDYEEI